MNQGLLVKTEGMLGSYAATRLDAEVWEYFAKDHAEQDYLKKKAIFAEAKESNAKAKAKELEKTSKPAWSRLTPKTFRELKPPTIRKAARELQPNVRSADSCF